MKQEQPPPLLDGKVYIRHTCGHNACRKIKAPEGSQDAHALIAQLRKEICPECKETKRREKDKRRTKRQECLHIATRLMAAVWTPGQTDKECVELACQAIGAAEQLLLAMEMRAWVMDLEAELEEKEVAS